MEGILPPVFRIVVFLYSVVIHEVSHGLMARSMGDKTAEDAGRLTLNPISHLDLFGSIILPGMMILLNVPFVFGYAKPVPYNPQNLSDRKYGPAKVAFAGPGSNLLLAALFGLVLRFLPDTAVTANMGELLGFVVAVNLVLAFFNLMPIPPLDGHWLLLTFLPARFVRFRIFLYRYSILLLFLGIFFVFPLLFPLIGFVFHLLTGMRLGI